MSDCVWSWLDRGRFNCYNLEKISKCFCVVSDTEKNSELGEIPKRNRHCKRIESTLGRKSVTGKLGRLVRFAESVSQETCLDSAMPPDADFVGEGISFCLHKTVAAFCAATVFSHKHNKIKKEGDI